MIDCNITKCPACMDGKCYSGDGNLRALNPHSKHPTDCMKTKEEKRSVVKFILFQAREK
jgi:hypothetical protein